jgi:hypothetical protein
VQPRWLAKREYLLIGSKGEPVSLWLQQALPKSRGKYRLDARVFKRMPNMALYKPTARRMELLGRESLIHAVSVQGPCRGTVLMLARLDLNPSFPTWVALNQTDLVGIIRSLERSRLLSRWFASLSPEGWTRVSESLELDDVCL